MGREPDNCGPVNWGDGHRLIPASAYHPFPSSQFTGKCWEETEAMALSLTSSARPGRDEPGELLGSQGASVAGKEGGKGPDSLAERIWNVPEETLAASESWPMESLGSQAAPGVVRTWVWRPRPPAFATSKVVRGVEWQILLFSNLMSSL